MGMFDNWAMGRTGNADKTGNAQNDGVNNSGNASSQSNGQTNAQNNDGVNPDLVATIWDETKTAGNSSNQNFQNNGNQGAQVSPDQQVSNFLKSQGLGDFDMSPEEKTAFQNGEIEGTLNKINGRIQQAYLRAMSGMNVLMEQKVNAAVAKAVGDSKEYVEGKELKSMLRTALPFASDPALGPVAETIFRQFLNKPGSTREKALDLTKKYFERTAELVGGGVNKNTGGSFRADNSGPVGDTDWMSALTGRN